MSKQLNVNLAFTADTSKAKAQLQDLQNQLSQVINMPTAGLGEQMATEINQAAHAAAELKVHLQNATNVKTGNLDFTKLNQSIKNSGSSLTKYAEKIQKIGPEGQKAFMLLAQSVASAEVPIRRSNALLSELWTTMKNTARWQLTSSMLHGFMGAIQSAVGYTEDLNESLNNIRIVTGNSVEQMADFAKEANKAAKALSTSTTNYTNAALIYYQQGLDKEQVLERADITTKMANVSRQSAEEVSDQMTAIWNNFYDGSQSLEHYADAMTRLGADTASSSDEIAQGLEKFAAIGDMIGLSFDNAAAALATVTATTRQSADVVGTAFKTIFARIQGLSLGETLEDGTNLNKYSEALQKVGISIFEQNGELKDMDNILDEMGTKWKTMSKDQQVALAQTVAGVRQYNQLVALMDNYDFYEQNLFSAQTADGSLQEQADIYAESWEAASKRVDAALEGLYDSLINDEAFIDLLNGIEKIVSATEMMIDSMGGFGGVVSGLGVIFTNVFRKQITQSITDASYSLMSWTESGRQKIQKEKLDQFSQMLQKAKIGETERAVLQAQFESYQQLTEKAKDLTDLERETYQILLDQQKARGKLAIQKKEEADQAKIQANDARAEAKWALKDAFGSKKIRIKPGKKGMVDNEGAIQEYENAVKGMFVARSKYLEARGNNSKDLKTFEDKYFNASKAVKNLEEKLKEAKEGLLSYKKALEEEYKKQKQADAALEEATGKRKENNQVIKEHTTDIEEESNEINNNTNKQNQNADSTKRNAEAHSNLGEAAEETAEAIEEENDKLNSSDIARNFVAGANAAMSAVSAIQAFSSAIDTINSDAEPMEKLTSVLMSVPMGVTMAGNALNGLNKIMVNNNTTLGQAAANTGLMKSILLKFGATADEATGAITGTGASLAALGGYALIAAAAIAAIVAVVKISIDVYNEDANAAKRASEAADNLSNSAKNAQDSVNDLLSTFDSYDSAIDKLEECAEKLDGTAESTENWQNALNDVNDQIWNILEKYPELAKMPDIFKDDGTLNRDVVDSYIAQQKNKADNARASALSAQARASQLQVKSDATNLRRGMNDVIADNTQDPDNYAKNQAQAFEMFNGLYELAKQENFNAEKFNTAVNDYIAGFEMTTGSFEDELRDAANDIRDLGKAAQAADTQMENVGKLLAKQILGANATEEQVNNYSSNYSEAEKAAYDEAIKATKNGINIWSGKDDAELQALWDRYSKATGTNYQLSSNAVQGDDLNRSFEYINEEGIKVVISAEELAAAIASSEAQTQAQSSSRDDILKPGRGGNNLSFLNGEIDEAVDTSLLNDLAQIMDLSDAATRQAIDAQLNMGQTAAEQTKIIEDMLSKMTAEEQELAEIAQLKANAVENYDLDADVIEIQAKAFQELYEAEKLTAKQATQLAIENQRMNNGVADLVKNWEDWNKELKAGKLDPNKKATSDYAKVIKDLTKTIADLTGASADLELPDEFFDEGEGNLELLEKAAKGSEQAINELGIAVAKAQLDQFEIEELKVDGEIINQEAINNFTTNKEIIKQGLTEIQEAIQSGQNLTGQGLNEILANSTVGSESWITALNEMAVATKMTTEEMNSLLNSMGLEADVKLEEKEVTSKKPITRTRIINRNPVTGENGQVIGEEYDTVTFVSDYEDVTETLMIPQINVNGGNDNQSSVTFIGNGNVSPTSTTPKGGGGSKKSSTKKKSDEIERYHTVNKEMESIESKMSRAASAKDNAFGKNKVPYIEKEINALNELINKHQEYKAEIEKNLKIDEANIAQYGFIDANEDGILDNWEAVMERELEVFNKAAQAYDKGGSETAFEAATKRYEDFKAFVEQYEETQKLMEDALTKEEELKRERISKQLEKIATEVDFEVEIKQRDLDKLDYVIDKLGRNANQMVEAIDKMGTKVGLYENQSEFYRNGIEQIYQNAAGRELTDDEQRQIWEYEDALLDLNNSLMDLVETVENSLLEEFERLSSEIDDNINRFDTYSSAVDHYTSIIKLSGRQTKDSMLLMELSAQKTDIAMKKLNSTNDKYLAQQKTQADVKSNLEKALKSGNQTDIDYWKKQYDEITKMVEESHNEMLGSWEEVLQAASDQFDQAIELTIQKLKDAISEYGLDGLADRYEKAKIVNEQYLSQLDKEYELNKLIRQMERSVDETDNIKAKQILNDLLDQANEKMAENVQLSQYDLEYMQKQYDLELARIALEEAQNAKSVVRLSRDNEGNFGYVYTADQDQVDDAQQNYEDKLAETRKLSEEYIQEMSDLIIQNEQDLMDALASIDKTRFETKEEYEAEVERITKYYLDRDIYLRTELDKAVQNSGKVYSDTILGQLENASKWDEAHNNLKTNTNEATDEMIKKWDEWKTNTEGAMAEVGLSSETFTEDIKNDMSDIGDATKDLANEIDTQTSDMITYMGNLVDAIEDWRKKYIDAVDSIIRKNKELALSEGRDTKGEVPTETPPAAEIKPDAEPKPDIETKSYIETGTGVGTTLTTTSTAAKNKVTREEIKNAEDYLKKLKSDLNAARNDIWKRNDGTVQMLEKRIADQEAYIKKIKSYDTGGYTGAWGPDGKLAFLHQKELVLNAEDTENILKTVSFMRELVSKLDGQASMASLYNLFSIPGITTSSEALEQTVTIHAEFPNAINHNEIEEAFNNLINTASQYANRK